MCFGFIDSGSEALILLGLARHLEPNEEVALMLVERQTLTRATGCFKYLYIVVRRSMAFFRIHPSKIIKIYQRIIENIKISIQKSAVSQIKGQEAQDHFSKHQGVAT